MALKDWVPQVRKALDQALTDHIALTQGKLSQANPKDTGRMASSWFVGKDQPDLQVRDKDWGKPAKRKYPGGVGTEGVITEPGVMKLDIPYYQKKITSDSDWYISNNLPYAQRVAYDPVYAKGAPGGVAWFTTIATQQKHDLEKQIKKRLEAIK